MILDRMMFCLIVDDLYRVIENENDHHLVEILNFHHEVFSDVVDTNVFVNLLKSIRKNKRDQIEPKMFNLPVLNA
jgi:hypothetical protein